MLCPNQALLGKYSATHLQHDQHFMLTFLFNLDLHLCHWLTVMLQCYAISLIKTAALCLGPPSDTDEKLNVQLVGQK